MVDFKAINQATTVDEIAQSYLQLDMAESDGELRGSCPRCGGEKSLVIRTAKTKSGNRYFTCNISKAWGDPISLVAHCHNISLHQAGCDLSKWLDSEPQAKIPDSEPAPESKPAKTSFDPLKYINTLKRDQEDVSEFGLKAEFCEESGIGLCTKGINKGRLTIPVHMKNGETVFIGVSGDVTAPKKWRVA